MPKTPKDNVRHLMTLTQWMLRGMAMDKHLSLMTPLLSIICVYGVVLLPAIYAPNRTLIHRHPVLSFGIYH
jgi:hypothetical protein